MPALGVLLAAALALLVIGALPRLAGAVAGRVVAVAGAVGAMAALVAALSPAAGLAGVFAIDGVAAVPLSGLFLLAAAAGAPPLLAGVVALALLAGNGAGLVVACGLAVVLAGPDGWPTWLPPWVRAAVAGLGVAVALVALAGFDPGLAVQPPPQGAWAFLLVLAAVLAGGVIALSVPDLGGLLAAALLARLLLNLAGPVTPGWWGGPVLLLGAGLALLGARRCAGAAGLREGLAEAGLAVQGVAVLFLGTALLARGADLLPLAALAVSGALSVLLAWGLWAALLALGAGVIEAGCGAVLAGMGGVLRGAPITGLAMLAGLASVAAVPLTPGFAGLWLGMQAMLGVARSGGTGVLLLMAGMAGVLGLVAATLAAAVVRIAGLALLGAPRGPGTPAESRSVRLALLGLAVASAVLGVVPGLGLLLVRRGTLLLASGPEAGGGWFAIGLPDAPGYAAPGLALLLAGGAALAGWAVRGPITRAAPWQGGFIEDGVGRDNTGPASLPLSWPEMDWGRALLAVLALALAALLGWAVR